MCERNSSGNKAVQSIALTALKFDPAQARAPKGSAQGGEFVRQYGVQRRPQGTTAAAMRQEPLPATLAAAEDRIRTEPNEHGFLVRGGTPIKVLSDDDSHHVRIDGLTEADMKDAVFTHNHPSGFGLSNKDGISAAKFNFAEMRAVTTLGTYSIRRTSTDWPSHFDESIADMHATLMIELSQKLENKTITVAQANSLHHDLMYRRLQETVGGFLYTFEPRWGTKS